MWCCSATLRRRQAHTATRSGRPRARTFIHPFDDRAGHRRAGHRGRRDPAHSSRRRGRDLRAGGRRRADRRHRAYVKAVRPSVQVIGVEPVEADAMALSLAAGRRVVLDQVGIFADGVAVREVGEHTFPSCADRGRDRAREQRRDLRGDQGRLRRHALDHGAGRRAGCRRPQDLGRAEGTPGARLVAVLSGANMNFDRLRFVAERAELGEAREALFGVTIPERPGRIPRVLRHDRPPRRHRVQLPAERPR
jgi:threonine dehydratase